MKPSRRFQYLEEQYIHEKAEEMAIDIDFIENFMKSLLLDYKKSLLTFLKENESHFEKKVKDWKKEQNQVFIKELFFVFGIARLLKFYENKYYIDYTAILNDFKMVEKPKEKEEINKIVNNIDDIFSKSSDHKSRQNEINFKTLHDFGNFILNFFHNFELRLQVIKDLISQNLEEQKNTSEMNNYIISNALKTNRSSNWLYSQFG